MKEWHTELSDADIQALKDNERCVQLIPAWMRIVFETMPFEDREYVNGSGWIADRDKHFVSSWTYRLRPDWTRPEKEPEIEQVRHLLTTGTDQLSDEEIELMREALQKILDERKEKPKEQGRWEYCEVVSRLVTREVSWYFFHGASDPAQQYCLEEAFRFVGFGGIEFAEDPGRWHMELALVERCSGALRSIDRFGMGSPQYKPATPKRCRFWVEK